MIDFILAYIFVVGLLKGASNINIFKGLVNILAILLVPFYMIMLLFKGTPKERKDVRQILIFLLIVTAICVFFDSVSH